LFSSPVRLRITAALCLAAVAGCDLGTIEIPSRPSQLVVHGVLNATAPTQTVLLERTLTGEIYAPNVFDVLSVEPILTDGGVPERTARLQLVLPDGRILTAIELADCPPPTLPSLCTWSSPRPSENHGAGYYVFNLDGSQLVPGATYSLHIRTKNNEIVSAETTFPAALPSTVSTAVAYQRDTSLKLSWPSYPPSAAYQLRVETPYGVWSAVTDSTEASLSGSLRSVNVENLPHVFIPGFTQALTISAVDANLYDYYRTSTNSATGTGIISRVHGALGVFGSMVTVSRRMLTVTAPLTRSIEGTYDADPGSLGYLYGPPSLTLYVESASARSGQADVVSASTMLGPTARGTAIGTLNGNRLSLVLLGGPSVADTSEIITAEIRGDSIVGTFSKGAPAVYIKH
jgi:uncharacterized protein DUF4249